MRTEVTAGPENPTNTEDASPAPGGPLPSVLPGPHLSIPDLPDNCDTSFKALLIPTPILIHSEYLLLLSPDDILVCDLTVYSYHEHSPFINFY